MKKAEVLRWWAMGMGAMDALTGLLLIFLPGLVTGILGLQVVQGAVVFLQWIGVFVMAVGMSYGLALWRPANGEAVWWMTGCVRLMVCAFLSWQIAAGSLPPAWGMVAVCDGVVGLAQGVMLRLRWWEEVRR